jgi:diaminopimelate decarboxylase
MVLAGPTCDSTDMIYEHAGYDLPLDLAIGDKIDFFSAGAYSTLCLGGVQWFRSDPDLLHLV